MEMEVIILMQNKNLFYEDTKKYRRFYLVITILFYIGFVIGVIAIVIYHFIKPTWISEYYQPNGEEFISTLLCLISAISFNILIVKLNYLNQSIKITDNEIIIKIKHKQIKYQTDDLMNYQAGHHYLFYKEYLLNFNDKTSVYIVSIKKNEIQKILNAITKR
jgi:hypothetical protein